MLKTLKKIFTNDKLAVKKIKNYDQHKEFLESLDRIGEKYSFYKREEEKSQNKHLNFSLSEDLTSSLLLRYNKKNGELECVAFEYDEKTKNKKNLLRKYSNQLQTAIDSILKKQKKLFLLLGMLFLMQGI